MIDLKQIEGPSFLKDLSNKQLNDLSSEIRKFLIDSVSETGGHLSSNLGVVELTIALHKHFNSPKDKIIWDVGHQSYVHKILTGRAKKFNSLRQYQGLSGFIKRSESKHDVWEGGHSSTSLSAASGMSYANYLKGSNDNVIAVIGDGSIGNGLSMEAINYIGNSKSKVIIVLNDNNMSINANVGALNDNFNFLRRNRAYRKAKKIVHKNPRFIRKFFSRIKQVVKTMFGGTTIFDSLGIDYYGLIDGHDFKSLAHAFDFAKQSENSVILHIRTVKGKGYKFAENDKQGSWHGVPPFNVETGKPKKLADEITWSEHVCNIVLEEAKNDDEIVVLTPAMISGSKLEKFQQTFPNRTIDVGIAEEHAITMAGGLASQGLKPFVSIYSTFLQRTYDQIIHDLAMQNLHVVIGVDRAGIVGADGETHQGLFDISILNNIPNVTIMTPKNIYEANVMFKKAFSSSGVQIIRYPRGIVNVEKSSQKSLDEIEKGTWDMHVKGNQINVISYSQNIYMLKKWLTEENISANLIDARFIKPLDFATLDNLKEDNLPTLIYEEHTICGSLGSEICRYLLNTDYKNKIDIMGVDDQFVPQGTKHELLESLKLDKVSFIKKVNELING